jgi:hypothetical protein
MQAAAPRIAQVTSIPIRTASARLSRRHLKLLVARRSLLVRSRRSRSSTLTAGRYMFYRKEKKTNSFIY